LLVMVVLLTVELEGFCESTHTSLEWISGCRNRLFLIPSQTRVAREWRDTQGVCEEVVTRNLIYKPWWALRLRLRLQAPSSISSCAVERISLPCG